MKKNTIVIIIVVVLVLSIAVFAFFSFGRNPESSNIEKLVVSSSSKASEQGSVTTSGNTSTAIEKSMGKYISYSLSSLTEDKNVIFFAANWCPTCRGLDKAINSSLSTIPSNLTILKADYDTETVLKQKYGVTYQHTLVQVDIDGNLIKKWNGSTDVSEIIKEIR